MATSDNETFAGIVKRVRRNCSAYPLPTAAAEMLKLVRELEAAHRREVTELRECLEQAAMYFCGNDKLADCIEKVYGNPKCETEGQHCRVEKWRKALEGLNDGKKAD